MGCSGSWTYETVAHAYAASKKSVADKGLVELGFEELLQDPLAALQKIYSTLAPPLDARMLDNARRFIAARAGYQRNRYDVPPQLEEKIAARWLWGRRCMATMCRSEMAMARFHHLGNMSIS